MKNIFFFLSLMTVFSMNAMEDVRYRKNLNAIEATHCYCTGIASVQIGVFKYLSDGHFEPYQVTFYGDLHATSNPEQGMISHLKEKIAEFESTETKK